MERLESKTINGKQYYYYSKWAWKDGKSRRIWQKYLGKLEDIAKVVDEGGPRPLSAEIFQWGLPLALYNELKRTNIIEEIDRLHSKRAQGMSTGDYIGIAALNRAICPESKRSMWKWFSQTVLLRSFTAASQTSLASQRFWDHMDRIDADAARAIWENVIHGVIAREGIDLSSISYDGTNFYTFIDTFNDRCDIAKRGKNKQGRSNLRQVNYALFCCADTQVPLYYDVYEGNRHDAKQFPQILKRFHDSFKKLSGEPTHLPPTTLVFDKGNNSEANFSLIDTLQLHFVGSVKLGEHKELALVSNHDPRFEPCVSGALQGTKAFRVTKPAYGRDRILVVSFNQNLYNSQLLTVNADIAAAVEKLTVLQQKLHDRACGIVKQGKTPSMKSVEKQCENEVRRPYLMDIIKITVEQTAQDVPQIAYVIDVGEQQAIADTYLGKNILITDRADWTNDRIIEAYRSQFLIEDVFKMMKDRRIGTWWPLNHWTSSKIVVHGLYCTMAVLLRTLVMRKVRQAGILISMKRLYGELDALREVALLYPRKRRQKTQKLQLVLTKRSELQDKLIDVLGLERTENGNLG